MSFKMGFFIGEYNRAGMFQGKSRHWACLIPFSVSASYAHCTTHTEKQKLSR